MCMFKRDYSPVGIHPSIAHPKDPHLVQLACGVLSNLAQHSESTLPMVALGVLDKMTDILRSTIYVDVSLLAEEAS